MMRIQIKGKTRYEVDGTRGRFVMTKYRENAETGEVFDEVDFPSPWFTVEDISESLRHLQFPISPCDNVWGIFVDMIHEMQDNEVDEEDEGDDYYE